METKTMEGRTEEIDPINVPSSTKNWRPLSEEEQRVIYDFVLEYSFGRARTTFNIGIKRLSRILDKFGGNTVAPSALYPEYKPTKKGSEGQNMKPRTIDFYKDPYPVILDKMTGFDYDYHAHRRKIISYRTEDETVYIKTLVGSDNPIERTLRFPVSDIRIILRDHFIPAYDACK